VASSRNQQYLLMPSLPKISKPFNSAKMFSDGYLLRSAESREAGRKGAPASAPTR
jgi:hypothetical protein